VPKSKAVYEFRKFETATTEAGVRTPEHPGGLRVVAIDGDKNDPWLTLEGPYGPHRIHISMKVLRASLVGLPVPPGQIPRQVQVR